jgi:MerR family transcriptional regulator, redox-sensitive transcriptional activator SoxR
VTTVVSPDVGGVARARELAERKLPELDQHIQEIKTLRRAVADCLRCGCMNFDRCVLLDTTDAAP